MMGQRGDYRPGPVGGLGPMPVPAPVGPPQPGMIGGPFGNMPPVIRPDGGLPPPQFGGPNDFDREPGPRNTANRDPRGPPPSMEESQRFAGRDPRSRDPRAGGGSGNYDPRNANNGAQNRSGGPIPAPGTGIAPPSGSNPPMQLPPHLAGADPGRTELIMQVLKLTDDQIAMLPAEQRLRIVELKKQIAQTPPVNK